MKRLKGLPLFVAIASLGALLPASASAVVVTDASNTAPITVGDLAHASPDPSDITVSGVKGTITDVNVFINGINHTNPDDFEILLQGPFGQTTSLMNDAGGSTDLLTSNISFNDQAGAKIPDAGPIASFGNQPSDYAVFAGGGPGLEPFLSPAPSPPYGLTLSNYIGTSPNGTWHLYVDDDVFNTFTGGISGGWSLSITSTDPPPTTTTNPPGTTPNTTAAKKKCKKKHKRAAAAKKCKKKK
jgi:subtilisin-like proprotein convertase family protein